MLDIKLIREKPKFIEQAAKNKGINIDITHLLELDVKYQALLALVTSLRQERNRFAKEKNIEKGKALKSKLEKEENALKAVEEELKIWMYKIPNIAKSDVKVGKDETENEIVRKYKTPAIFKFKARDHIELGDILDIIDIKRAAKVSGARFAYLKNEGALLEFALLQFAVDFLLKEAFIPVIPPVLINLPVMEKLGYMENGGGEDMFRLSSDGKVLVGTAEQSIVPMHMDEIFVKDQLPKRYLGFSSSFRREAGSYGKDTKGILRVHQFDKLEMVSYVRDGQDDVEHDYLLSLEEKLLQALEIPYQVVKMCTGDLGFPAARKYDLEAWIPSQGKYREVTSTSTTTDFQSRRLNIKYEENNEKKFVRILNGTAFAIGRTLIAIIENFQEEDGSVVIPTVLRKYLNNLGKISPKKR